MKTEKMGQEQAFPIMCDIPNCNGISKRLFIATMAIQGMLANMKFIEINASTGKRNGLAPDEFLVKTAYSLADEMLKQENE